MNTSSKGNLGFVSCHEARGGEDLQCDLVGLCGAGWRITLIITPQILQTNEHLRYFGLAVTSDLLRS